MIGAKIRSAVKEHRMLVLWQLNLHTHAFLRKGESSEAASDSEATLAQLSGYQTRARSASDVAFALRMREHDERMIGTGRVVKDLGRSTAISMDVYFARCVANVLARRV